MQGYGLAATIQPLVVCPTASHATAEQRVHTGAEVSGSSCSVCGPSRLLSSAGGGANVSSLSLRKSSLYGRGISSLTASSRIEKRRGVSGVRKAMPRAALTVDAPVEEVITFEP
jgi:hypothetical protein